MALGTATQTAGAASTQAVNITKVGGTAIALGQALMAASFPVVIASNQGDVPVSGTFWQATQPVSLASVPSHAVTNAGTFAVQATLDAETTKVIGTVNISAAQTITVTNAGLTELAAAINGSSQMDVNIAASGATVPVSNAGTFATQATLQAGTNGIGKLTANSGVDIGDVDVLSIAAGDNNIGNVDIASAIPAGTNNIGDVDVASITNGSLNGPGSPTIDSYTRVAINLAAGANQVLVSSAANKQIWVYGIGFVVNAAGTVSFQDEDDTAITGIMPLAANGGMVSAPSGNFAMPMWKLATDKDLEVDIVTSELDGWLSYAIVSV